MLAPHPQSSYAPTGRLARLALATLLSLLMLSACATNGQVSRASSPGAQKAPVDAIAASLDARVPALLSRYGVASVGIALIDDGQLVFERAYGRQSDGVPATTATLYGLASLTKPVSAEVLLRLVGVGKLSLDAPMASAWIDPDVANDERARMLTMRHALAHQSGLPNWRGHTPDGKLRFAFAPGSAYAYSGEGYDYAARYAEHTLGRTFEQLAQETVLDPLGMRSTSYSMRAWMRGRLAVPLDSSGRWGEPQVEDSSQWNAGNNLITTPGDYARFVMSVMRNETLPTALAAERLQPARGPQPTPECHAAPDMCPRFTTQVLGWMRLDFAAGPAFMHTGSNGRPGGEQTVVYFDPNRRRGVVVLTSGTNGARLYRDVVSLLDPGAPIAAVIAAQ